MNDMVIIPKNAPRRTLRAGVVVRNEETEKIGIYGLPAAVVWEQGDLVRVYVYVADKDQYQGPYALKAQEVIP